MGPKCLMKTRATLEALLMPNESPELFQSTPRAANELSSKTKLGCISSLAWSCTPHPHPPGTAVFVLRWHSDGLQRALLPCPTVRALGKLERGSVAGCGGQCWVPASAPDSSGAPR